MELPPRPTLFDFHGVSMTKYFTDNWVNIQSFKARPDDIVLVSYPKAGNTWVSYILDLLYFSQTSPDRQNSVPLHERVPFLEISIPGFPSGVDELYSINNFPRIIKTHLPVQFLPQSFWEQNSKIIYVARNAKDSAVSYFHFDRMNKAQPEPGDWSSYLQRFMDGKMVFGSWHDHVGGWWEKRKTTSNILYLFYEDLIEVDTERELSRLCSFLRLSPCTDLKKEVTEKSQFNNMKHNKMANGSADEVFDFQISPFLRKGRVGDWKNHFTVKQDEEFNEDYERKMKNTDLHFRTVL
ncbi:cytosolic sulfotransferase 2-like isoform X3 [Girardinichthys multiradiatus]|uniref:cytosolic sulfotransferase 2-like isoform X3 n=1 Tax=Girardinichthys multiradiatus TaxID=208333 RepID=UPI001FAC0F84|nr:cytosolic sulfotransferase 2-like isoform X3 [Girardinichthys multiradiatus]